MMNEYHYKRRCKKRLYQLENVWARKRLGVGSLRVGIWDRQNGEASIDQLATRPFFNYFCKI